MKNITTAIVLGFIWALWPILAQKYARGHYAYTLITIGTMLTVFLGQWLLAKPGVTPQSMSYTSILWIPLAMGVLNGLGMIIYPMLLNSVVKPSVWVSVVTALVCVAGTIVGAIMTKQISLQEIVGTVVIALGIAIMIYKPTV